MVRKLSTDDSFLNAGPPHNGRPIWQWNTGWTCWCIWFCLPSHHRCETERKTSSRVFSVSFLDATSYAGRENECVPPSNRRTVQTSGVLPGGWGTGKGTLAFLVFRVVIDRYVVSRMLSKPTHTHTHTLQIHQIIWFSWFFFIYSECTWKR